MVFMNGGAYSLASYDAFVASALAGAPESIFIRRV
jgi:hypothetical protein